MVLRRRSGVRRRRRFRRLIVLGGAVSGMTALRNVMLARNERRFPDLVAEPANDQPR